jgi:uncharacterized protein (TIGR03435 family)
MNGPEVNIEKILSETLRATPEHEMDAAGARVLHRLRAEAAAVQETAPVARPARRAFRLGVAAAAAVVILISVAFLPGLLPIRPAVVETAGGGLYRFVDNELQSLAAGEKVSFGEHVRTTGVSSAVLRLTDESRVEVRADSELSLEQSYDGLRILLDAGEILIEAARQRSGHLYVQTKDVTVAVVGTVFLVKAGEEGSRVAVFEGEVLVRRGDTSKTLLPGQEVSTSPDLEAKPVTEEIPWSRRAERHIARLQQPAVPAPVSLGGLEFETVSIRPEPPSGPIPSGTPGYGGGGVECLGIDGRFGTTVPIGAALGRCTGRHVSLMWLISAAYGLGSQAPGRIVQAGYSKPGGGPGMQFEPWISNLWEHGFSIDARAENPAATTSDQLQQMLQSMLEDRFKLKITREMRPVRELGLLPARGGPRLREAPAGAEQNVRSSMSVVGGARQIRVFGNGDLKAFASALPLYTIADKTGVTGIYTFDFSFLVPIPPPTGGEGGPRAGGGGGGDPETAPWFIAMQEALQDQLGLRVEYATVPAEFVIIHQVEKPSEN